jgi:electron transfer flavoprotein beta subunit
MSESVAAGDRTRIVCCVRQALDWNLSTKDFRIDPQTQAPAVAFARYRIDQFDEIALEVALKARRMHSIEVHALSVASRSAEDVLKHALAMGADRAELVEDDDAVSHSAAALIAAAVHRSGGAAAVLCGRVGSERGSATTAPLVAELLGLPLVTNVVALEKTTAGWICRREATRGYERVLVRGPLVASVTNASFNVPRIPTLKDKMRAHRQTIEVIDARTLVSEAGYERCGLAALEVIRRYVPQLSREGRRLDGEIDEQAQVLAEYISTAMEAVH